jgi:hypothetical protein
MIEGIYKVAFETPLGSGEGLVHIAGGKIGGGDMILYSTGSVQQSGDDFAATIRTGRHATVPGSSSVFGKDAVSIDLTGKVVGNDAVCEGTSPDAPGLKFKARLHKLSD